MPVHKILKTWLRCTTVCINIHEQYKHIPPQPLQPSNSLWPSVWTWTGCSSNLHLPCRDHGEPPRKSKKQESPQLRCCCRLNRHFRSVVPEHAKPGLNARGPAIGQLVWRTQQRLLPLPRVLCCWWPKWRTDGLWSWEKRIAFSCGRHRWETFPALHGTSGLRRPTNDKGANKEINKGRGLGFYRVLSILFCHVSEDKVYQPLLVSFPCCHSISWREQPSNSCCSWQNWPAF